MALTTPIDIPVRRALTSRIGEVDWNNLAFGQYLTDHMLICDYAGGRWKAPQIVPYADFSLPPATLALHYGQTVFEGLKAYRLEDGRIHLFRPQKHYERLVKSAERLCMPAPSQEVFLEGLRRLVETDRDWVPSHAGSSLYLRPFIIATEARLRAHISDSYRYTAIASPSGAYYQQPVRVKVEREFVRAAKGGTGYAKCGGNYGGSFYPTQKAKEQGYDQVLWTDGRENKYIEESGAMNVMFVIDGTLVTPPLSNSILDGVTRDSLLTIARDLGISVAERPVPTDEIKDALAGNKMQEAFGVGTAAVVSPICTIGIDGTDYDLPVSSSKEDGKAISATIKSVLEDIRYGRAEDRYGWNYFI